MKLKWKLKQFICKVRNYFLCVKYPFIKSRNVWTGKFLGYSSTWYDQIPDGWRKAFGKQLLKDLKKALINDKDLKTFRFHQIKEKYGSLRLYCSAAGKETSEVLRKYEKMSEEYCIGCGKKAEFVTSGWIYFLCRDCFEAEVERICENETEAEKEAYRKEHLIEK